MGKLLTLRRGSRSERAPHDEESLLARCRSGDREAMGIVLGEHAEAVERHIVRLMGPGAEVEDVAQQVFIAAIRAFPRFRGEAKVRTWLIRIATHVTIDVLRSPAWRRRSRPKTDVDERDAKTVAPDEHTRARRELRRLSCLLDELSAVRRVAFIMHVLEGRPIAEVAVLTGASKVATKSRIFWARRQLLKLARRDPVLADRFEGGR